jgi:hypothetical protein
MNRSAPVSEKRSSDLGRLWRAPMLKVRDSNLDSKARGGRPAFLSLPWPPSSRAPARISSVGRAQIALTCAPPASQPLLDNSLTTPSRKSGALVGRSRLSSAASACPGSQRAAPAAAEQKPLGALVGRNCVLSLLFCEGSYVVRSSVACSDAIRTAYEALYSIRNPSTNLQLRKKKVIPLICSKNCSKL